MHRNSHPFIPSISGPTADKISPLDVLETTPALALIHALFSMKGAKAKGKSVNPFVSSISAKPLLPTPKPSNEEAKTTAREQIEVRNSRFDSASVAAVLGRMLPLFAV